MVINYRITPFGNPGVNGYVLLSPAYRSLSRPSSSYSSQASAINLYSLDHITIFAFYFESSFKTSILFRPYHPFYSSLVRSDSSKSFVSSLGKLITGNRISFPFLPLSFQKTLSFDNSGKETTDVNKALLCFAVCTHTLYFPFLKRR